MLDVTPENLREEILSALELQRKHTSLGDELLDGFVGTDYQEGRTPDLESHENHAFETVANVLPHLVWDNPKVSLKSGDPDTQRTILPALEALTNWWITAHDLSEILSLLGLDCFFGPSVALVTMAPAPGYEGSLEEDPRLLPKIERLSPKRVFVDPQGGGAYKGRFAGHWWIRDKEDLLRARNADGTPKFNHMAVQSLKADGDLEGRVELPDGVRRIDRQQVIGYEVWVPERKQIFTLAFDNSDKSGAVLLRKPRKAVCPPWGPYTHFGCYAVPDQVYPLPMLSVTKGLCDELNAHIDQVSEQADHARSFTVANATNDAMVNALKSAGHGDIVPVPGFDSTQVEQITVDGPSREQLDYIDRLRMRLDRKSGITQTIAGNITGATKGEVDSADSRADVRIGFMQRQFRRCVRQLLRTVVWHLVESNFVQQNVEMSEPDPMGMGDKKYTALYQGGTTEEEPFDHSTLQLEIQPFTMEYTDERVLQANMQAAFGLVVESAPMMPQLPYVRWGVLLDDLFQTLNIRDGRKYFDWPMLDYLMQNQVASTQPTSPPGDQSQNGAPMQMPRGQDPMAMPQRSMTPFLGRQASGLSAGPPQPGGGRFGQRQLAGRAGVEPGLRATA